MIDPMSVPTLKASSGEGTQGFFIIPFAAFTL